MSLPEQEARALDDAQDFLLALGSGQLKIDGNIKAIRAEARRIMRHYPLGPGAGWLEGEK